MLTKEQWRRRKRRLWYMKLTVAGLLAMLILLIAFFGMRLIVRTVTDDNGIINELTDRTPVVQDLLTVNEYSRPGTQLEQVTGIVIHFADNPGADAQENRNYFESLRLKKTSSASTHFVVGIDGEIRQCIPTEEISMSMPERGADTISILYCHQTENGEMTTETYESLVALTAYLCERYELTSANIYRHFDITGKECPRYFSENPLEWERFKAAVNDKMQQ